MDEHEKAMREAANHDTAYMPIYAKRYVDLIREQVRRTDEACVYVDEESPHGIYRRSSCKGIVTWGYSKGDYCPKCGKRIKVESNEEKESGK